MSREGNDINQKDPILFGVESKTGLRHRFCHLLGLGKETRRMEQETDTLYQLSQKLAATDELETSLDSIISIARERIGYDISIYLPDYGNDKVLRAYPESTELISKKIELSAATWSYQTQKRSGHDTNMFPELEERYIPLLTSTSIVGVLAIKLPQAIKKLDASQDQFLGAFTSIAAMAIEHGLVKQGLDHLASFPKLNPQPIIELNTSEHFLYINPAADKVFPDLRVKGSEHPYLEGLETVVDAIKDGNNSSLTRQVVVDGRYFQQTIILTDEGTSVRVYGVDITERLKLAEETQRMKDTQIATEKLQTAFLDSISHDLRTPLSSIIGVLSSLQEEFNMDDTTRKNLIQVAHEEANRLNNSITNLLDISKIEAGVISLSRQLSDIHDIISMALDELGERTRGRNIKVSIEPELHLIFVDFNLILRVIFNLIDNALKYSPSDSPIEINAKSLTQAVEIEVTDRGIGIPPEDLPYVFYRFYRGHKINVSGTGLGLSICKGIIEAHGGTITAGNRPGGGTIMKLTLPLTNSRDMSTYE
jgi:K+-sensing histidine kinase KdpD